MTEGLGVLRTRPPAARLKAPDSRRFDQERARLLTSPHQARRRSSGLS
jgi:hypothetical protein